MTARRTQKRRAHHEPNTHYDTPRKAKVVGTMEFLSETGGLNGNPYFKEDVFRFYGMDSCAGHRLLKRAEEEAARASPCPSPDADADGDPDSEFSPNEEVEGDNPGALPTDHWDDVTRRHHHLRLHTEKRGSSVRMVTYGKLLFDTIR